MPESLRSSIIATYRGATTQVRTPHGLTEAIELIAGVLQGDTLAPTLFNLVINAIMREIEGVNDPDVGICFGPTRGHLHVRLKHLEFVDDIVLLSRTAAAAEKLLRKLVVSAQKYGLKVNYGTGKTEVIVLGSPVPRSVKRPDGVYLREVHDYKYLGSMLMSCREDFLRNKNLAWQVIHRLKSVWRSTLRLDLKALLFKALVLPVYLSGAETWFVGTDLLADISGTYTCMVRYVRGVKVFSRDTRVTNSDLFGSQFARVEALLQERRLRFAGHCARSEQPVARVMMASTLRGKKRGRPMLNLLAVVKKDLRMSDPDSKVKATVAATLERVAAPHRRTRKQINPRGHGSGRPRKFSTALTPAARRMRHVNALKYIDQLVCAASGCDVKGCSEHCVLCRSSLGTHVGSPILTCRYCKRRTAASCAGINRAQAATLCHSFVCKDCSVLQPDLYRR